MHDAADHDGAFEPLEGFGGPEADDALDTTAPFDADEPHVDDEGDGLAPDDLAPDDLAPRDARDA